MAIRPAMSSTVRAVLREARAPWGVIGKMPFGGGMEAGGAGEAGLQRVAFLVSGRCIEQGSQTGALKKQHDLRRYEARVLQDVEAGLLVRLSALRPRRVPDDYHGQSTEPVRQCGLKLLGDEPRQAHPGGRHVGERKQPTHHIKL